MATASVGKPAVRAFEENTTRRWGVEDFDAWLADRLCDRWGKDVRSWQLKMLGYQGNDYLFITNDDAVMLAKVETHDMSGQPVVREIFAFSRAATKKDEVYGLPAHSAGAKPLRALYKQFREWAAGMKATRVYVGVCSDMVPSELREMMGRDSYYVVGSPP